MNEEWIKGQVNTRDSLEDALAQSTRAVHFAVNMARTVGTLADAVERVRELHQLSPTAPSYDPYCQVCHSDDGWPCLTIRALQGEP